MNKSTRNTIIIVNGCMERTSKSELSYHDILIMAAKNSPKTITFRSKTQKGVLHPGQHVRVEDGIIFDAVYTGNA